MSPRYQESIPHAPEAVTRLRAELGLELPNEYVVREDERREGTCEKAERTRVIWAVPECRGRGETYTGRESRTNQSLRQEYTLHPRYPIRVRMGVYP